jgi:hypothetical protein
MIHLVTVSVTSTVPLPEVEDAVTVTVDVPDGVPVGEGPPPPGPPAAGVESLSLQLASPMTENNRTAIQRLWGSAFRLYHKPPNSMSPTGVNIGEHHQ